MYIKSILLCAIIMTRIYTWSSRFQKVKLSKSRTSNTIYIYSAFTYAELAGWPADSFIYCYCINV